MRFNKSSNSPGKRAVVALTFVLVLAVAMLGLMAAPAEASYMAAVPIADAGKDVNITSKETVTFDGSGSEPSDGATITNYTWTFTITLGNVTNNYTLWGESPEFWFNISVEKSGLAVLVTLNVTDSSGQNATDSMYVIIRPAPPSFFEKYWFEILLIVIAAALLARPVYTVIRNVSQGQPVITDAAKEKARLSAGKNKKILKQLLKNPMGAVGVIILVFFAAMAAFGPAIAPYDVKEIHPENKMQLPSPNHWMGTDNFGVDIFSELLFGARTSIIVGMVSAIIASFLGAAVGLYSGYVGGWKDEVVMRLNDIVLSIPWLVLMIVVAALLGQIDLTGIILIIGLTGWSTTARMVRAQVLSVRERQYIERARSIGASEMDIIRRHVFPNTFPLVFANTILTVAVSILSEATLSFLGLRPVGEVTWGTMLSYAQEASAFQVGLHWWIMAPGLCIVVVVLGFTLLGYALDEILNPKLRHR
jgi:peptide/nickel transport system permease protein